MANRPSLILAFLFLTMSLLSGVSCQSGRSLPSSAPAPTLTKPTEDATRAAIESEKPLARAEAATALLPDSPTRTDLTTSLAKLRSWWASNLAAWHSTADTAKSLDAAVQAKDKQIVSLTKEVATLSESDPIKMGGQILGGLVAAVSIGVFVLSFFYPLPPFWRGLSIAGFVFGLIVLTLTWYLHAIRLGILWTLGALVLAGLISGAVWLFAHRKMLLSEAKKAAAFGDVSVA